MIIDAEGRFSNAQVITVTAASTNQIDFGRLSHAKNSNGAADIEILLTVGAAFTAGGAGTLTVQVRSDDDIAMGSPQIHCQSAPLSLAQLVLGAKFFFQPRIPINIDRYVDLNYIVGTGPMLTGNITAAIVTGRQINQ